MESSDYRYRAKILVVDDRLDNLELLSTILQLHGYEVNECQQGKLAIKLAKTDMPDLILLDINMPEINGFSICRILKSDRLTQDIPIVFISALQEIENKIQGFKFGGNDYITKPFQVEEVIARVENQLKLRSWQTKLEAKNQQLEVAIKNCQNSKNKLLKHNQKLNRLANFDGLTNIANRYFFERNLTQEWQRGQREKFSLGLILCDIDFFKLYNDTFGHQAGDTCLRQVAQGIATVVNRPADLVARYGGEEFAVILPHTSANNALLVAEKIRLQIKSLDIAHPDSLIGDRISLSLGVSAIIPSTKYTKEYLLSIADKALYQAKEQGRDQTVLKYIN